MKSDTLLIMMQKDEDDLLNLWLNYHSEIVGMGSLYVIDDSSSSDKTIKILDNASSKGVHVIRLGNNRKTNLGNKGLIIEVLVKMLFSTYSHSVKCIVPLDCDEFLVGDSGKELHCDPSWINKEIKSLPPECIYKTFRRLNNAPWSQSEYIPLGKERPRKLLLCSALFSKLDLGFHSCTTNVPVNECNLSYIHLHNRPFNELVNRAKVKLKKRVDITDTATLVDYRGIGWHLAQYLCIDESKWIANLRAEETIKSNSFIQRLHDLGLSYPYMTIK